MEDIVVTSLLHKGGDKPFTWIIVDWLTLKDRMMNARQRAWPVEARFFGLAFLFFVSLSKFHRHRFEIEAVLGIGGMFQTAILELFQQKRHALKAIAAMAITTVSEEAEHGFVDLDPTRRLRAVGCHRALRTLRTNRTRTVGNRKSDQNLQGQCFVLSRTLPSQRQKQEICHRPASETFVARYAPQTAMLMVFAGDRGADYDAVEPQIPRQGFRGEPRDALAHQRSPRDRGGNRRKNRVARRPPVERLQEFQKYRFAAAVVDRFQHGFGTRVGRFVGTRQK